MKIVFLKNNFFQKLFLEKIVLGKNFFFGEIFFCCPKNYMLRNFFFGKKLFLGGTFFWRKVFLREFFFWRQLRAKTVTNETRSLALPSAPRRSQAHLGSDPRGTRRKEPKQGDKIKTRGSHRDESERFPPR